MATIGDKFLSDGTYTIPYFGDWDVATEENTKTGVLIVVHGSARTASSYYTRAINARSDAGAVDNYAIISIQYPYASDYTESQVPIPEGGLLWTSNSWGTGANNNTLGPTEAPTRVRSSMHMMEEMIRQIRSSSPNITHINMWGHSAGGQFTSRFPSGNAERTTPIKYITANSSLHMWWNNQRPDRAGGSRVPAFGTTTAYNDFPYGLDNLYSYFANVGEAQMRVNQAASTILFHAGTADDDYLWADMAKGRSAAYTGMTRMQRARDYVTHLKAEFSASAAQYTLVNVPHVAHQGEWMIRSLEGQRDCFTPISAGVLTPDDLMNGLNAEGWGVTLDDIFFECFLEGEQYTWTWHEAQAGSYVDELPDPLLSDIDDLFGRV